MTACCIVWVLIVLIIFGAIIGIYLKKMQAVNDRIGNGTVPADVMNAPG